MLDKTLLDILVCPSCKGALTYQSMTVGQLTNNNYEGDVLICQFEKLAYPVRDGIPVLLVDEAMPLADRAHIVASIDSMEHQE